MMVLAVFRRHSDPEAGFTLVELMVVIAIIAILFAISTVNLGKPQTVASLNTTVDTLVSDLKSQQLLAMTGDSGSTGAQQRHGIYIQSGSYTLFTAANYNPGDTDNFTVDAANGVSFSTSFLSNQVVFDTGNGNIDSFASGHNSITVTGSDGSKTIRIDRLGAIDIP